MRFVWATAAKDLRRRLADPLALAAWIGLPLLVGVMIAVVGGVDGHGPTARLLIVDGGDPTLAALIDDASAAGLVDGVSMEKVGEREGHERLHAGEADALLRISSDTARLSVRTARPQISALAEEGARAFVDRFARWRTSGARSDVFAEPAAITLARDDGDIEASDNRAVLFLPGVLLMSLLLISAGMGEDIWTERAGATLRRALRTPHRAGAVLGGKLLAGTVIMGAVSVLSLVCAAAVFGVAWSRVPGAALLATLAGTALLCLFLVIHVHSPTQHAGRFLSTMVLFPLLMLGGSFFPLAQMPAGFASIGRWTPNGLVVTQLEALLSGSPDPASLALTALVVGIPGLLAFLLASDRIRRSFGVTAGGRS